QAKKSVFMITDAEGVAGVCRQDQTEPKDSEMRQLLTGEINAAVEGFLSGGADEVVVWDGHDGRDALGIDNPLQGQATDGSDGSLYDHGARLRRCRLHRTA